VGVGNAGSCGGAAVPERSLVARFCVRSVSRWAPVARPRRGGRLHARVPSARCRHIDLAAARCARARPAYGRTRPKVLVLSALPAISLDLRSLVGLVLAQHILHVPLGETIPAYIGTDQRGVDVHNLGVAIFAVRQASTVRLSEIRRLTRVVGAISSVTCPRPGCGRILSIRTRFPRQPPIGCATHTISSTAIPLLSHASSIATDRAKPNPSDSRDHRAAASRRAGRLEDRSRLPSIASLARVSS
jgi:hypothetical protein